MKLLFAFILGAVTTKCAFKIVGWNYNPFHDPLALWMVAVSYGTPVGAFLMWLFILQKVSNYRAKRSKRKS